MSWIRRSAGLLAAAALAMPVAACSTVDRAVDCAAPVFTYQDRTYVGVPDAVFTPGKKLGTAATTSSCDEDGSGRGESADRTETAYAVNGIPPEVAIALYGETPDTALLHAVDSGSGLPPEVRNVIDPS
ncbi:DUF6281 family protein [uncultured Streptomyces sp.]|uniref:DUF6281 family protein n=1 Tax=uncultured Streptomyces sp. TaxID=174707 RepID=UPI0026273ED0|nr:DUF6281 family protein [uncultured Streptomyces sp.]